MDHDLDLARLSGFRLSWPAEAKAQAAPLSGWPVALFVPGPGQIAQPRAKMTGKPLDQAKPL